jgi:hypothetical protein
MLSFDQWKLQETYMRNTVVETTMEEAMLDFFYNGITPWIQGCGYSWINGDSKEVARHFLRFCYELQKTIEAGDTYILQIPKPKHRNLPEDLDTFQSYVDSWGFTEMLSNWSFYDQIVGSRLDNLIVDFTYNWVDVEKGLPGRWTQKTIEMNEDEKSDDERAQNNVPDGNWSRRKHDLY